MGVIQRFLSLCAGQSALAGSSTDLNISQTRVFAFGRLGVSSDPETDLGALFGIGYRIGRGTFSVQVTRHADYSALIGNALDPVEDVMNCMFNSIFYVLFHSGDYECEDSTPRPITSILEQGIFYEFPVYENSLWLTLGYSRLRRWSDRPEALEYETSSVPVGIVWQFKQDAQVSGYLGLKRHFNDFQDLSVLELEWRVHF